MAPSQPPRGPPSGGQAPSTEACPGRGPGAAVGFHPGEGPCLGSGGRRCSRRLSRPCVPSSPEALGLETMWDQTFYEQFPWPRVITAPFCG